MIAHHQQIIRLCILCLFYLSIGQSANMDAQIDCVYCGSIKPTSFYSPSTHHLSKIYLLVIYQLDCLFSLTTCQIFADKLEQPVGQGEGEEILIFDESCMPNSFAANILICLMFHPCSVCLDLTYFQQHLFNQFPITGILLHLILDAN